MRLVRPYQMRFDGGADISQPLRADFMLSQIN